MQRRRYTQKQPIYVTDVAMYPLVGTGGGLRLNRTVDMHHAPSCLIRQERTAAPTRYRCVITAICVHSW